VWFGFPPVPWIPRSPVLHFLWTRKPGFSAQTCAAPQAVPRPLQVRQYGTKKYKKYNNRAVVGVSGVKHKKFKLKMFYAWANHNKARKCHLLYKA